MRPPDSGTAMGIGMTLAAQGLTLGLEFALPPLAGSALDQRYGFRPALTLVGAALGFAVGMWHILRLSRGRAKPGDPGSTPGPSS